MDDASRFSLVNLLYRLAWRAVWLAFAAWTPPPLFGWRRWLLMRFGARLAPSARVYGCARVRSPAHLTVGDHATIGRKVTVSALAPIIIGDHAIVSQGALLCTGPITIAARAWIAAEAYVGPGVTVGEGAVLGARGCAMHDLAAWTIYRGDPAQPVRARRLRIPDAASEPTHG